MKVLSGDGASRVLLENIHELLAACGVDSVAGLVKYFENDLDSDLTIDVTDPNGIEFVHLDSCRGIVEPFPISLGEIWDDLLTIEDEYQTEMHLLSFIEEIEAVEGFEAFAEFDVDVADPQVVAAIRRRITPSGLVTQDLQSLVYEFSDEFPDQGTIGEWRKQRLRAGERGLIDITAWDDDTTLGEIRGRIDESTDGRRPRRDAFLVGGEGNRVGEMATSLPREMTL